MTIAILYEHANFDGDFFILRSDDMNLEDDGWNDKVSSMIVFDGGLTVYKDNDYHGEHKYFQEGKYYWVGSLWDNEVSSIDLSTDLWL
jgi:Beta/Gamma crystallin